MHFFPVISKFATMHQALIKDYGCCIGFPFRFWTNTVREIWVNKSFPVLEFLLGADAKLEVVPLLNILKFHHLTLTAGEMCCKYLQKNPTSVGALRHITTPDSRCKKVQFFSFCLLFIFHHDLLRNEKHFFFTTPFRLCLLPVNWGPWGRIKRIYVTLNTARFN